MNEKQIQVFGNTCQVDPKTAALFPDALFIIELHHRYVGTVWFATDKQYFINAVEMTYEHDSEAPDGNNFDEWAEYAANDLRSMPMLNLNEAIDWVVNGNEGATKLVEVLESWGFIEELGDDND